MTRRRVTGAGVLAAAVVAGALTGAGGARAATAPTTRCSFGGPAGTSRVLRLDLPEGSRFLNVTLDGARTNRPVATTDSWHLASGVFVVHEATGRLVSFRISSAGAATRRTVVEGGGTRPLDVTVPGPDVPFSHTALRTVPGLAPGSYLVAAFGSDGSAAAPNDGWGGHVEVSGARTCEPRPAGRLLDVSHADFTGGTQVSTSGAGVLADATLERRLDGHLVVGLMDASTHVAGSATLRYALPGRRSGVVDDEIVPFVAPGGTYRWRATTMGVAPVISVVALGIPRAG